MTKRHVRQPALTDALRAAEGVLLLLGRIEGALANIEEAPCARARSARRVSFLLGQLSTTLWRRGEDCAGVSDGPCRLSRKEPSEAKGCSVRCRQPRV